MFSSGSGSAAGQRLFSSVVNVLCNKRENVHQFIMAFQYYMAKAEGDLIISLGQQTAENYLIMKTEYRLFECGIK